MATGQTQQAKKRLFLVKAGRTCPLYLGDKGESGFNAVAVYSFLVYRLKAAKGNAYKSAVSNKQIQRGTGLDRNRTIPAALQLLEKHNLIGTHNGRAFAYEPADRTWFVLMKHADNKPWFARFAYFPIWIPATVENGLTPRQNALFWLVKSRPCQKQSYYALCLGISSKTVQRTVSKLRKLELMSLDELASLEPAEPQLHLWQDKAVRKTKKKATDYRLSQNGVFIKITADSHFEQFTAQRTPAGEQVTAYDQFCEFVDFYGHKMQRAGYTTTEIEGYWTEAVSEIISETKSFEAVEAFILDFSKMLDAVEEHTRKNRAAGLFNGANSLGLLKRYTKAAIKTLVIACDNRRQYGSVLLWSWQPPSSDPA